MNLFGLVIVSLFLSQTSFAQGVNTQLSAWEGRIKRNSDVVEQKHTGYQGAYITDSEYADLVKEKDSLLGAINQYRQSGAVESDFSARVEAFDKSVYTAINNGLTETNGRVREPAKNISGAGGNSQKPIALLPELTNSAVPASDTTRAPVKISLPDRINTITEGFKKISELLDDHCREKGREAPFSTTDCADFYKKLEKAQKAYTDKIDNGRSSDKILSKAQEAQIEIRTTIQVKYPRTKQ